MGVQTEQQEDNPTEIQEIWDHLVDTTRGHQGTRVRHTEPLPQVRRQCRPGRVENCVVVGMFCLLVKKADLFVAIGVYWVGPELGVPAYFSAAGWRLTEVRWN